LVHFIDDIIMQNGSDEQEVASTLDTLADERMGEETYKNSWPRASGSRL
jgi:hypothetical protein